MRRVCAGVLAGLLFGTAGCKRQGFPEEPVGYREYAFVANADANTVSVLDLVAVRADRTLPVGSRPIALGVNPVRNEIYSVNQDSDNVSVIDADGLRPAGTIAVRRRPASIAVDPSGKRAYIGNAGSNSISVVDLELRREIAEVPTAGAPESIQLSADGRSLVVTHRRLGTIEVYAASEQGVRLRAAFSGCQGASASAILPDSSKAFVACSEAHQVMAVDLAAAAGSWAARQDASLMSDRMLTTLEVGSEPAHLALKPDGGEIFVSNFGSGSVSEIATQTNEVGATTMIGNKPSSGIVSRDSTLYVANSGDDAIGLYSIDDGKLVSNLHTGSAPGMMAFSADEHLLLAVDTRSGDVSVIRTQGRLGPNLFTILPAGASPSAIAVKVIARPSKP